MAKNNIPPLIGSNFITWHHDGRQFSISKQDGRFVKIRELLKARKFKEALLQFDKPAAIAKYTDGKVQVYGDSITYNGEVVNGTVVERILNFIEEGLPFEPLVKFLNNLYQNTDKEIREALYDFIEWNGLTITDDGAFVAYKLVTDTGKPIYNDNGLYTYELGKIYEMAKCETVKARGECSSEGFYAGSAKYWHGKFDDNGNYLGDGKMFVVKIFPQHVISVPVQSMKLCVYKFEIIEEYKKVVGEFKKPLYGYEEQVIEDDFYEEANCCGDKCECAEKVDYDEDAFPESSKEIKTVGTSKGIYGMDYVTNVPKRDKFGRFIGKNATNNAKPKRNKLGHFISTNPDVRNLCGSLANSAKSAKKSFESLQKLVSSIKNKPKRDSNGRFKKVSKKNK